MKEPAVVSVKRGVFGMGTVVGTQARGYERTMIVMISVLRVQGSSRCWNSKQQKLKCQVVSVKREVFGMGRAMATQEALKE